jgi:hypothetical protein
MKKKFYKISLVLMLMTVIPFSAMAQDDPGEGPDAPIDGGLSVLIAAGAAYGVKKYREHKKQQEHKEEDIT